MNKLWRRITFLLFRRKFERDLEEEMRFHVDMKARAGGETQESHYSARRQFGNTLLLREESREMWGWGSVDRLMQDLRYGVRMLVHNPSFTLVAVLTLAVGIGVNTAIFTAFNAVALRPLEVPEPERVMELTGGPQYGFFSYLDYVYLRNSNHAFSGLTAANAFVFSMSGVPSFTSNTQGGLAGAAGFSFPQTLMGKNAEPVLGMVVAGNYFRVLGVQPILGRDFIRGEDDRRAAHPVLLMSENFWERRFARDPGVLGRTIIMNDVAFTVIGITPRDFTGTAPVVPSVWTPMEMRDRLEPGANALDDRTMVSSKLYGRLAPGVAEQQAQAETDSLVQRLKTLYPQKSPHDSKRTDHVVLKVASPFPDPEELWTPAMFVLGAVSLVLFIACANVASLLLARSAGRQKEIAIRLAIGAGRGRLVRQLMTESALISALAGVGGLLLAWWVLRLLMLQIADSIPTMWVSVALHLAPDHRVFAYLLALSTAAAFAFGLAPALQASKPSLTSALKEEGGAFGGLRKSVLRDVLVGMQVMVSLVLLIGAGLLARGSQHAFGIDLGFEYRRLIAIEFRTPTGPQEAAKQRPIRRQLIGRIEAIPGVKYVSAASSAPLAGGIRVVPVAIDGRSIDPEHPRESFYTLVSPDYFDTVGIPIVRGRSFNDQETRDGEDFNSAPVIVSENTARNFWPGQDPIGKRINFEPSADSFVFTRELHPHSTGSVVIGVAKDIRSQFLEKFDDTCMYMPVRRDFAGSILVRTGGDPAQVTAALHKDLPAVDPNMEAVIFDFRSEFSNQPSFVLSRLAAIGSAIIGILGLALASVGIYGMVNFAVSQRTHEVGIRMALGARREDVLRLLLRESMRPVLAGIAAGILAAAAAARLLVSLLFGLSTFDPPTFLVVSGVLASVALLAGYIPARRATKVDPMVALRYE